MVYTKMKSSVFNTLTHYIYLLGTCFSKIDICILIFVFAKIFYSIVAQEAGVSIKVVATVALVLTLEVMALLKLIALLITVVLIGLKINLFPIMLYFYPNTDRESMKQTLNYSNTKKDVRLFPYESIRKIVLAPGRRGYFSYKAKLFDKFILPLRWEFQESEVCDITFNEWLDTVKQYNPNVKIKAYKHRFWMF